MKRFVYIFFLYLALPASGQAFDRNAWTMYPAMNSVTSLAEGDQQIFVGTTGGIRRYDRFYRRWLSPVTTLDGLPDNRIYDLAYNPNTGDLWFDTPSGAARWLSRLESVSFFSQDPPRQPSLVEIPPVSLPYGYYLQNGWIQGPRQSYAITDALIDSWRVLWIGTRGLGVGRADLSDRQLEFHQYGPIAPNITALARDGDAIWFGGTSFGPDGARGITRYNLTDETWQYFESDRILGLDDDRVYTILPDTADVWFGTRSGLVRYNRKHDRWLTYRVNRHASDRVTALARAGNRLWIGTEEGLAVFDTQADTVRIVGGSEQFDIRVLATGPRYIWAGTDYGLFRCPLNDVVWTPAQSQNGLTNNRINGLMVRENDVWATVESPAALIHLARPDTVWQRFPLSEVGGIQRVSIAADTSRVWLGTDLGAFRFDIGPKLWTQYTRSNGLIYERVQAVLLDGHFVWFGTEQGASRYHWTEDFFETTH